MKQIISFFLCLSLFAYLTFVQAQEVVKRNTVYEYKSVDDSLLLQDKKRIMEIDSTLKAIRKLKPEKLILIGVLGFTCIDLVTNYKTITKTRKTLDWIGVSLGIPSLAGFVKGRKMEKILKRERNILDVKCLQLDSLKKIEITNWERAASINTVTSYQNYINEYPAGRFIFEAKSGLELPLWEKYSSENTVANYIKYLTLYPSGKYVEEASNRIDEPMWREADFLKSLADYQKYLKFCPTGIYHKDAKARISEKVKEAEYFLLGTWECIDDKNSCIVHITFNSGGEIKLVDESDRGRVLPLQNWHLILSELGNLNVSMTGHSNYKFMYNNDWVSHPNLVIFATCIYMPTTSCNYELLMGYIEGIDFKLHGFTCKKIK